MAEKVQVQGPITATMQTQRKPLDVATELTIYYYQTHPIGNLEEIRETFLKFYTTVEMANRIHFSYLKEYLPDELKDLAEKFR